MRYCFSIAVLASAILVAFGSIAQTEEAGPAKLDRDFKALLNYQAGGDVSTLEEVKAYVDEATKRYRIRVDAEARLLAILESRTSSAAAKEFAANQLYRLCDGDTVSAFRKLLLRSDTSALARRGLELITHPNAETALLETLDQSKGSIMVGIVESLGNKRDPAAINALRRTAKAGNAEVCRAALVALGKIPDPAVKNALQWCRTNLTRPMRPHATDAYIQAGWTCIEFEDFATAIDIFDSLLIEVEPIEIRAQGLRGLIRAERDNAVPIIIEAMTSEETALQAVGAEEAERVPGRKATEAFMAAFPDLVPENQAILLHAFAKRGDDAVLTTVTLATKSRHAVVRQAAIEVLRSFNHPEVLQPLLKVAATGTPEERRIAHESILQLSDPRIDDALVKAANSADNAVRFAAVTAMGDRNATAGIPILLRIAERDVRPIRLEALTSLGVIASVEELAFMVDMMLDDWSLEDQEHIARSIAAIGIRAPSGAARTEALSKALGASSTPDASRIVLINALEQLADDTGLPAIEAVARKQGGAQQRAVEVLVAWKSDAPIDALERVASGTRDPQLRAVAFNAFMEKLQQGADNRPVEATVKYYQRAVRIAETPDEKRRVISGVSTIDHPDAIKILDRYAKDKEVGQDAVRARDAIARNQ